MSNDQRYSMARNPNNTNTTTKSTVKRDEQGRSETGHPDYWTKRAADTKDAASVAKKVYLLMNAWITHADHRNLNDAEIDSAADMGAILADIAALKPKFIAEVKANPAVLNEIKGESIKAIKAERDALRAEIAALKAKRGGK
jgi:hypothetical protein